MVWDAYIVVVFELVLLNEVIGVLDVVSFEGRIPEHEGVEYDSYAPDIHFVAIPMPQDYLRCDIVWCPTYAPLLLIQILHPSR